MKRPLLLIVVGALYFLHQDFWFWRTARPLVFGFIPIGLFYHACYTLAIAAVMWLLVKHAWPTHLELLDRETGLEDVAGAVLEASSDRLVSPDRGGNNR